MIPAEFDYVAPESLEECPSRSDTIDHHDDARCPGEQLARGPSNPITSIGAILALTAVFGHQAAFLAAGGYHHHLGANTWESAGASMAPPGTAALRHFTIVLPDEASLERVLDRVDADEPRLVDPSGNELVLEVAGA